MNLLSSIQKQRVLLRKKNQIINSCNHICDINYLISSMKRRRRRKTKKEIINTLNNSLFTRRVSTQQIKSKIWRQKKKIMTTNIKVTRINQHLLIRCMLTVSLFELLKSHYGWWSQGWKDKLSFKVINICIF